MVSLTVDDILAFLNLAQGLGFTVIVDVQDLPYGLKAQLGDLWGNRLPVLEVKEG